MSNPPRRRFYGVRVVVYLPRQVRAELEVHLSARGLRASDYVRSLILEDLRKKVVLSKAL